MFRTAEYGTVSSNIRGVHHLEVPEFMVCKSKGWVTPRLSYT